MQGSTSVTIGASKTKSVTINYGYAYNEIPIVLANRVLDARVSFNYYIDKSYSQFVQVTVNGDSGGRNIGIHWMSIGY